MNSDYITRYNTLALKQSELYIQKNLNCPIAFLRKVDASICVEVDDICKKTRQFLKKQSNGDTSNMQGYCFIVNFILSEFLLNNNVEHTITIGDIEIKGKSRYQLRSMEDAILEFDKTGVNSGNYVADSPLRGHAWITLENGVIIDPIVLVSLSMEKNKKVKWNKAIYCSAKTDLQNIRHVPCLLGPEYIFAVGSNLILSDQDRVANWYHLYNQVNS